MVRFVTVAGLLLLAFGGYIAGIPAIAAVLPTSPILIGAALTAVALAIGMAQRPDTRPIVPLLGLAIAFIPGFVLAPDGVAYADQKVFQLLTLVPLTVVGAAICAQDRRTLKWLVGGTLAVAALVTVLSFVFASASLAETGRFAAEGSNTIAAGRAAGAGFVVAVLCAMYTRRRLVSSAAAVVLGAFTVFSGSRGAIAAAAIGLAVAFLLSRARASTFVTIVGGLAAWFGYRFALSNGLLPERVLSVDDTSIEARLLLADITARIAAANPVGLGWGSMANEYGGYAGVASGGFFYPHNIFLEAAAEGGWIAGVALVVVFGVAVVRARRASGDWLVTTALALLVFFAVNAFVSGDLMSNRGFWLMLGVCLAAIAFRKAEHDDGEAARTEAASKSAAPRQTGVAVR